MLLSALLLLSPATAAEQMFTAVSGTAATIVGCTNGTGNPTATTAKDYEVVLTQTMIDGMNLTGVGGVYVSWNLDYSLDMYLNPGSPTNDVSAIVEMELERTVPVFEASWSFDDADGDDILFASMGLPQYFLRDRTIQHAQVGDIIRLTLYASVAADCTGTGLSQSNAVVNPSLSVPKLVW